MSAKDLQQALCGPKGSIDAYLEVVDENEFRADVLAFADHKPDAERRKFAAMAMQGLLAAQIHGFNDVPANGPFAVMAVGMADALIAALSNSPASQEGEV